MTRGRKQLLAGGAALIVLVVGIAVSASGKGEARGSSLSRGPNGWLAARRYLQARGTQVSLLRRPLERFQEAGVLVVAFPWQQGLSADAGEQLEEHLRRGGDLLLAWSGDEENAGELVALTGLGFPLDEARKATLNPIRWRQFSREEWDLAPAPGLAAPPVRIWAPRSMPELPREAKALFRTPEGKPAVAVLSRYRGRIWILPADAFANARLGNPGNAALLETLRVRLGDRWTFDEYHHGLSAAGRSVEARTLERTLDLILLHLGVLYIAGLLTLARRFGPAWSEAPVVTGTTGSFLAGLGAIHHRLGHHREAAQHLLARVREMDRGTVLPTDLDRRAETAGARELVDLARDVARLRRGGTPAAPPSQDLS